MVNIIKCNICPRNCGANRSKSAGFCGASNKVKIAKVMLHYYEEPIISGDETTKKCGSGAIFFSHCSLKCIYCQNQEISQGGLGKEVSIRTLASIFKQLEEAGATNINLVSPTHYVPQIIQALNLYRPNIPIVYNTSGYENVSTLSLLEGYVDVYLTDFKYISDKLAKEYSAAPNYPEVAKKALAEMKRQQPKDIINGGLMEKGVIIRHLLLPNASVDATKIFDYIGKTYGKKTYISLMSQYTPCGKATTHPILKRRIKPIEYKMCENYLKKNEFVNVFLQDLSSATLAYTPDFKTQDLKFKY